MKTGSARAGSLLLGAVCALALPAVAIGQIDPSGEAGKAVDRIGDTVQQAVPQVQAPVPVDGLSVPSTPDSSPAGPAPATGTQTPDASPARGGSTGTAASSGSAGRGTSGPSSGAADAARSGAGKRGNAGGAKAASSGKSKSAAGALGQDQAAAPVAELGDAGSFTAGREPGTGVIGDSRLPFTGGYLLLFVALGAAALLAGLALRGGARTRLARRHGH
jgi:hypothetical protein